MKKQLLALILSASMIIGTSVGTVSFAKEPASDIQEVQEEINQNHSDEAEEKDAEASQASEEPGEGNALETESAETVQAVTEKAKTEETEKEALSEEQKASDEVETQAQGTTIYVDGDNANNGGIGDDSNSGLTKDKPVKTLKKAAELAGENGTIIVLRTVFIREDTVLDNNVTVKRGGECSVGMIYLNQASLTVNHATIDGNKTEYPNGHPLIVIYNNPTLTINDGAKLCNNNGNVIEQVSMSSSDRVGPEVIMNGGEICDNVIEQGKTNSKATIYMAQRAGNLKIKGGSIHDNQAGGIDLAIPGFEMTGGEIYNNNTTSTTARYGGIYVRGRNAVISGGRIYGNTSTYGGGINVSGQGDLTITGTALIEGNSAEYGAGVFVEYGKLDMQGGTIRNNKDAVFGGGIFLWNQDSGATVPKLKCRASVSGGTIEGNTAKYGNGIAFYEDTGTGYPILELSGSPDIKDAIYLNDSQDMEAKVSVTGALTLKQPVPIYDSKWTDNRVIVSYAPGLTAKKADFVKYAKTSTQDIKLDGQDLQSINVQPQTFDVVFKEQDGSREYRTIQVEENGKIDQTQVPTAARDGYTLTGWKSAAGTWDFANDAVTGRTELYPVWKLNAPKIDLSPDKDHLHEDETQELTLTAGIKDPKDTLTYTYKWYREGNVIAGAQDAILKISEPGAYKVEVTANDGNTSSDVASKEITITKTNHEYGTSWESDATQHWKTCNECRNKADVAAHIFGDWSVETQQTRAAGTVKVRSCQVCGYEERVTVPVDPGAEKNISVSYEFISKTKDAELPSEVLALLPKDTNSYAKGDVVKAIQPEKTTVKVTNGTWKFEGYDAEEKEAVTGLTFTGSWTFTKDQTADDDKKPGNPANPDKDKPGTGDQGNGNQNNGNNTAVKGNTAAKTGDFSQTGVYMVLTLLSGLLLAGFTGRIMRRKNR